MALHSQIRRVIDRIKEDPDSRQLFISIWNTEDITKLGGISRVPCSLGYQIQVRRKSLNLTYLQRSADLVTHFTNDVYLAFRLQSFLASCTGYEVGPFVHWIGSLHMFRRDGREVF
jgi:thymidylate synthase